MDLGLAGKTAMVGGASKGLGFAVARARRRLPNLALSNVLRSGVTSLAKTLSVELAPDRIRVNTLIPGRMDTDRPTARHGKRVRPGGRRSHRYDRSPGTMSGDPKDMRNRSRIIAPCAD